MSDAPHRYTCPRCGSRSVGRIQACRRPRGKRYSVGGGGVQAAATDTEKSFRCEGCNRRLPHVYDLAENRLSKPVDP